MIYFVLPAARDWTVREYLSHWGRNLADRFRILPYESLPARTAFDRGTYVLSALQLTPGLQRLVEELHRRLSEADGFRFLNHPTRTLRRFALLEELRRLNRNEFRAVRATGDPTELRYPIFLRSEWDHTGNISPLLHSAREIDGAIGRALLLGHRLQDLLAVEFCDTADDRGFYRKYSAYIVGDRILARNLECGHEWMIKHARSECTRSIFLEERDYVFGNPHERELAEIFSIAGVEYGRIDYAIKNGRIQTWEINLHPTIGRGPHPSRLKVPPELEPIRRESREHFYRGFEAAWRSVDLPDAGPSVTVALDPSTIRAASSGEPRRGRLLGAVRWLLQPVKFLLEPLSRPLLPLIARLARRRQR